MIDSSKWSVVLGQSLRVMGAIGMVLSVVAMILIPIGAVRAISFFELRLAGLVRETAELSTEVASLGEILDSAVIVLESAANSLHRVEDSVEDTQPVIESTSELLTSQTPEVIENTVDALDTAATGAQVADVVLRGLSTLEPLTGVAYDPEQPLDQAMKDVSASLEPLPDILREVGQELDSSRSSLDQVSLSLNKMTGDLKRFAGNVDGLQEQVSSIADLVKQLSAEGAKLSDRVPMLVWTLALVIEFIFLWILLNQMVLYIVGRQMIESDRGS